MRFYTKELIRLRLVKSLVNSVYPSFGVNKKQEITRLLYEISKRECAPPAKIIEDTPKYDYKGLKRYLLQRRYPDISSEQRIFKPYLPKIELKSIERCNLKERKFYPKHIFVEKNTTNSFLVRRLREIFPAAKFSKITSLKDYLCEHRRFQIKDYNKRQDAVFIVNKGHDFFKKCPCTRQALACGYHIFNLGFGCIYECIYCYLQDYANGSGIILPANLDDFFDKFNYRKKAGMRLGTGEFLDSLALDRITGYSIPIIKFFSAQKGVIFEFKTKGVEIGNILKTNHAGNIVVSWSLNPQSIIDENEYFTPSLNERLSAAAKCIKAGYRVGFHLDPIIYFNGWENEYKSLVENLFDRINFKRVAWISMGTFRFSRNLKQIIEKRFPENKILNEELVLGYDAKLRYSPSVRFEVYKTIKDMLFKKSPKLNLYLCMEDSSIWNELRLKMPVF